MYKYRKASKEKTVKVHVMLIKVIVQPPGAMYMLDYCKVCNYMHISITVYDVRILKFIIVSATVKYSLTSKRCTISSSYSDLQVMYVMILSSFPTSFMPYRLIRHSIIKNCMSINLQYTD